MKAGLLLGFEAAGPSLLAFDGLSDAFGQPIDVIAELQETSRDARPGVARDTVADALQRAQEEMKRQGAPDANRPQ